MLINQLNWYLYHQLNCQKLMLLQQSQDSYFYKLKMKKLVTPNKQPMYSNIPLVNQNTNRSHQSQNVNPHDQSNVILQ